MKTGDIILYRNGHTFISKAIMFFMRIYKRKCRIQIPETYSHAGTIIDIWGILHVAESNAKGYEIHTLLEAYPQKMWDERIDVYTPIVAYTEEEKTRISYLATNYSIHINRYDYLNFIYQLILVFFGKWIGPTGETAENKFYCSEASATLANYIRPNTFINASATNPMDIAINPYYVKNK